MSIIELDVTQTGDDAVVLSGRVVASVRNGDSEWATFTDVIVVGYNQQAEELCRTEVGTVQPSPSGDQFELECETVPPFVTLIAEQTACDDDVDIGVYEFEETRSSGTDYGKIRSKECGEPKLPVEN